MAYTMTYTSLGTSVKRWLIRENDRALDAELPRIIDTAERKTALVMKTLMSDRIVSGTLKANHAVYTDIKPSRWLDTISVEIFTGTGFTDSVQVEKRSYEYCRQCFPAESEAGVPRFYSDFEFNGMMFFATPDLAYPYQHHYYERPQPLGDDVQQNLLTQRAPEMMLYASLSEAAAFVKQYDMLPHFDQKFNEFASQFDAENQNRKTTRTQTTRK